MTAASAATSVSQFGITWTFDKNYTTGQFANGDNWVVGPVKITAISPRSTTSGGASLHGSMVNPSVNTTQGYDSRIKNNPYAASANAGASLPLTLPANSSLLSSESYAAYASGDNPQLKTIAILTVLSSPPPAGSFRPPYIGSDKRIRWNKSDLQYAKLRSLRPVAGTPSLSSVEQSFERPWIEQKTNWTGRYMHPGANQPTYGREMAHTLTHGLLSLQLNYSAAQKEKLLVRLVQYGIDIYGAAKAGASWYNDGGHNPGRKMPLILAGMTLGDSDILTYANGSTHRIFQEDQQTWYVTQSDVGRTLYTGDGRPRVKYVSSDVGMAEWGEKHTGDPSRDGRNWDAYYRTVAGSPTTGHVLAARLMGAESIWNWRATFDYYDRYFAAEKGRAGGGVNSISTFAASMWNAYRNATPSDYTEENVATKIWENTAVAAQKSTFTLAFDMVPSANKMDGVVGLSNGSADAYSDLATIVRFAPNGYMDARDGGSYRAAAAVPYTAGVKYHVVMSVDVAKKRYSVTVKPAGGASVRIADNWSFRSERASVTTLNNVGFFAESGAHAILDIGIESAVVETPAPVVPPVVVTPPVDTTPVPEPSKPDPTPAPKPVTSGSIFTGSKSSSGKWQNIATANITGKATVTFDMVAGARNIDTITAITSGSANDYNDLAVALRFAPNGLIDGINGKTWSKVSSLKYVAGTVYRVTLTIDVKTHRYSAVVTPSGGSPVTIASNFQFRSSQLSVKQLNNFILGAGTGKHTVSNATIKLQ